MTDLPSLYDEPTKAELEAIVESKVSSSVFAKREQQFGA